MSSSHDIFNYPLVVHTSCSPFQTEPEGESPTARLRLVPGRDQDRFEDATLLLVGLGAQSVVLWGALRSGASRVYIMDDDFFSMSNYSRQIGYPRDQGYPKVHRVARNLRHEAVNGAEIVSIALPFPDGLSYLDRQPDIASCLVDDNRCRLEFSRFGRRNNLPVVISGLSHDGLRSYTFLQTPGGPCIACALGELEPVRAPCVAACAKAVFMVAGHILQMIDVGLMGWPEDAEPYNLRFADLNGRIESTSLVERRPDCPECKGDA